MLNFLPFLFSLVLLRTLTLPRPTEIQTFLAAPVHPARRVSADTTSRFDGPASDRNDCSRGAIPGRETVGFSLTPLQVILRRKWKPLFFFDALQGSKRVSGPASPVVESSESGVHPWPGQFHCDPAGQGPRVFRNSASVTHTDGAPGRRKVGNLNAPHGCGRMLGWFSAVRRRSGKSESSW